MAKKWPAILVTTNTFLLAAMSSLFRMVVDALLQKGSFIRSSVSLKMVMTPSNGRLLCHTQMGALGRKGNHISVRHNTFWPPPVRHIYAVLSLCRRRQTSIRVGSITVAHSRLVGR